METLNHLNQSQLTVGKSYFCIIDEVMSGYPQGVFKAKLLSTENTFEEKSPVLNSHFQFERVMLDPDLFWVNKSKETDGTYVMKDIDNENWEYISFLEDTPENEFNLKKFLLCAPEQPEVADFVVEKFLTDIDDEQLREMDVHIFNLIEEERINAKALEYGMGAQIREERNPEKMRSIAKSNGMRKPVAIVECWMEAADWMPQHKGKEARYLICEEENGIEMIKLA